MEKQALKKQGAENSVIFVVWVRLTAVMHCSNA